MARTEWTPIGCQPALLRKISLWIQGKSFRHALKSGTAAGRGAIPAAAPASSLRRLILRFIQVTSTYHKAETGSAERRAGRTAGLGGYWEGGDCPAGAGMSEGTGGRTELSVSTATVFPVVLSMISMVGTRVQYPGFGD